MPSAHLKIDDRAFRAAFKQWMFRSQKTTIACLRHQAKLFVRDIVRITPPGHSVKVRENDPRWRPGKTVRIVTQAEARRIGQNVIKANIARVMKAGRRRTIADSAQTIHQRFRNKRGRVAVDLRKGGDRRYVVPSGELKAEIQRSLDNVGVLASGWNAAASELGLKMPEWIGRHGTNRGQISIKLDPRNMSIKITNAVRFAGNVRDLERRVNWALMNRARQMDKQLAVLCLVETAEQSGFRVRK